MRESQPPTPVPTSPPFFLDKIFKGSHKIAKKPPPHQLSAGSDPYHDLHSPSRYSPNRHSNNSVLYNPSYRNVEFDPSYTDRGYGDGLPFDEGIMEDGRGRGGGVGEEAGNFFNIFNSGASAVKSIGVAPSLMLLLLQSRC
ncbi:uncharacterized protein LOC125178630 [Hyalella azteca]|uniref:Uncharacterized protein LOC125178630 n=1 Tax=Hyalella azteca TaxID=294128 RepID=A0A979FQT5_HYAAZ|nr:uncharacterized protein LOC125178630 [Hyalella azteca]